MFIFQVLRVVLSHTEVQQCLLQWTHTKGRERWAGKASFLAFFMYQWPSTCRCLGDESGKCRQNKCAEGNGNSPCFYSYTEQYHLSVSSNKHFHSPSASIHFNSCCNISQKIQGQGVLVFFLTYLFLFSPLEESFYSMVIFNGLGFYITKEVFKKEKK